MMARLLLYLYAIVGSLTFLVYGLDKFKAKRGFRRTPEWVLLGMSMLGGSVGGLLGMQLLRHKTRHRYFWTVNLLSMLLQLSVWIYVALGIRI